MKDISLYKKTQKKLLDPGSIPKISLIGQPKSSPIVLQNKTYQLLCVNLKNLLKSLQQPKKSCMAQKALRIELN